MLFRGSFQFRAKPLPAGCPIPPHVEGTLFPSIFFSRPPFAQYSTSPAQKRWIQPLDPTKQSTGGHPTTKQWLRRQKTGAAKTSTSLRLRPNRPSSSAIAQKESFGLTTHPSYSLSSNKKLQGNTATTIPLAQSTQPIQSHVVATAASTAPYYPSGSD